MTTHEGGKAVWVRRWLIVGLVVWVGMAAGTALAQSVSSGAIQGTVTDESSGVLPGVTVTLSSPSLQVQQIVQVTDSTGGYKFADLPAGTYRLKAELPGFTTSIRDALRLTVGFVATINLSLSVGAMQETVTVSGQGPIIDVTSTSASVAFTKETLDAVPRGRDLQNIIAMAPGVTAETPDVGGSSMAQRQDVSSYGVASQPKLQVEGMNIAMGADMNTPIYFNDNTLEEVQIKTSDNDAEVSTPGISMVAILKSGSNTFHGAYAAAGESSKLQSSNLNDSLRAQGLKNTAPLKEFYDVSVDLGGRVVRDKLWFYGAFSRQAKKQGVVGFVSGPGADGRYLTGDEPIAYFGTSLTQYTAKMSYQISRNNRVVYAWQRGTKAQPQNGAGRFVPLESTRDYTNPTAIQKVELQSALTPHVLLNAVGGFSGYITDYNAARSFAKADAPARNDIETGLWTGSHPLHQNKTRDRYQTEDSISFSPSRSFAGQHELKTGVMIYLDRSSDGYSNNLAGNYVLYTDKVNGVSGTPARIQIYNTPVVPADHEDTYAWYLKDSWRPTKSVTFNLGLRWERQHSYLPAQTYEGARDFPTLFPAGSFSKIDVQTFSRVVPRIGAAWDLGGKAVLKATAGEYNYMLGDTYADAFNRNATANATFRWHDLNGDKLYQPGEVNVNENGPDFISITAAKNRVLSPELKQPRTWESTASLETELAPSLAFRTMYVYRRLFDYLSTINTLRPYDAYNIPITRRDPGPDGLLGTGDDAGNVTFYDYDPAYRGAAFVNSKTVNNTNSDSFQSIEWTVTKRSTSRWMAQVSYFVVKDHHWNVGVFQSPNDNFFPLDETWSWAGNANGSYRLPGGVTISGFLQSANGLKGARTNVFRQVDPDGGKPIAQLSNVTLRLEPAGSRRLAALNILNLRASKSLTVGGGRRISVDVDVFNALNAATATAATFASGPSFGYVTNVVPGRIARIGARFTF
jgi:hypothetical protein